MHHPPPCGSPGPSRRPQVTHQSPRPCSLLPRSPRRRRTLPPPIAHPGPGRQAAVSRRQWGRRGPWSATVPAVVTSFRMRLSRAQRSYAQPGKFSLAELAWRGTNKSSAYMRRNLTGSDRTCDCDCKGLPGHGLQEAVESSRQVAYGINVPSMESSIVLPMAAPTIILMPATALPCLLSQ